MKRSIYSSSYVNTRRSKMQINRNPIADVGVAQQPPLDVVSVRVNVPFKEKVIFIQLQLRYLPFLLLGMLHTADFQ